MKYSDDFYEANCECFREFDSDTLIKKSKRILEELENDKECGIYFDFLYIDYQCIIQVLQTRGIDI